MARTWVGLLLLVGCFWITYVGGIALLQGERVQISAGLLISGGVTLALMVLPFAFGTQALRFLWAHVVWAGLSFVAAIALVAAVGLPLGGVILGSAPTTPTLAVGLAMLVAWVVLILVLRRTGKSLDDPLVPPTPASRTGRGNR